MAARPFGLPLMLLRCAPRDWTGQYGERLAGDVMLGTERSDRAAWRVIGPLNDGKADTGVDRLILSHQSIFMPRALPVKAVLTLTKFHHQNPPKSHRCLATQPVRLNRR